MNNADIAVLLRKEGIYRWEIARKLGIHEGTFSRWFRSELSREQMRQIIGAIEEIKLDRVKAKG